MATKKTAKSSKTAHVLNVLAGAQAPSAGEETIDVSPATPRPLVPPILEDARANDQALVGTIHDALAQELDDEEGIPMDTQSSPVPAQASVPAAAPVAPVVAPVAPVVAPVAPVVAPVAPVVAPAPAATVSTPSQNAPPLTASAMELPGDLVYVNIMQALVEEKVSKYVEMFGLCTCSRCMADVKALALSNLPPRYLVMPKGAFIPMLTVYERQYLSSLTAQIISACKQVMEFPRH